MSNQDAPASGSPPAEDANPLSPRTGMGPVLSLTLILAAFWVLWSGHFTPFLLGLGATSCVGVVALCHRMGLVDSYSIPVRLLPRAVTYLPWLAWQVVLANFEVMRHILSPRPGDEPRLVQVTAGQKTDVGGVTYANSITLTPGTFTLETDGNEFTVHALNKAAADGLLDGAMDRRVTQFEGLTQEGIVKEEES